MKKAGFTLAELLIVLGITGVLATIILASVSNLMPDKTKIMYLKVHKELIEGIKDLTSNSAIFSSTIEINNKDYDISKYPLLNIDKPIQKNFDKTEFSNKKKICSLLAFSMNASTNNCKDDSKEYSDSAFNTNKSFTTANGIEWWIIPKVYHTEAQRASYQTDIYVDVDSSKKSPNCLYSTKCKQPDRFKFLLASDGSLIPADPMGIKYLDTQKSWIKRKYKVDGDVIASLDDSLLKSEFQEAYIPNTEPPVIESEPTTPTPDTPQQDDSDVRLACGDNFEYGNHWIKYTVYPVANRFFYRDQLYSPSAFNYSSTHAPVDISVKISQPISHDYTATIALWNDTGNDFVVRQTCTIKAGNSSCNGEPIDTTRNLNAMYNIDTIYTYDWQSNGSSEIDLRDYTYFYVSNYLDIKKGFTPWLEAAAHTAIKLQSNSNSKCVHFKRLPEY